MYVRTAQFWHTADHLTGSLLVLVSLTSNITTTLKVEQPVDRQNSLVSCCNLPFALSSSTKFSCQTLLPNSPAKLSCQTLLPKSSTISSPDDQVSPTITIETPNLPPPSSSQASVAFIIKMAYQPHRQQSTNSLIAERSGDVDKVDANKVGTKMEALQLKEALHRQELQKSEPATASKKSMAPNQSRSSQASGMVTQRTPARAEPKKNAAELATERLQRMFEKHRRNITSISEYLAMVEDSMVTKNVGLRVVVLEDSSYDKWLVSACFGEEDGRAVKNRRHRQWMLNVLRGTKFGSMEYIDSSDEEAWADSDPGNQTEGSDKIETTKKRHSLVLHRMSRRMNRERSNASLATERTEKTEMGDTGPGNNGDESRQRVGKPGPAIGPRKASSTRPTKGGSLGCSSSSKVLCPPLQCPTASKPKNNTVEHINRHFERIYKKHGREISSVEEYLAMVDDSMTTKNGLLRLCVLEDRRYDKWLVSACFGVEDMRSVKNRTHREWMLSVLKGGKAGSMEYIDSSDSAWDDSDAEYRSDSSYEADPPLKRRTNTRMGYKNRRFRRRI
ncbi:hypothetical protein BJ508DRAFT_323427 [Ascobolus immersus RN42]|uniref:Uncharacterized protein n=1 Tax=Ascobolus immersus RN42 TaxID=1160509 RepID=A0A3N4IK52_ASCIM|nr:hypothetical protein BJ508DRAFT_323427 [Ascobolus immersus RN42]